MTMLANTENFTPMSRADYEARIYLYREQIGTGYIGIGRTLNEAKAAKVVPHGQWEAWVVATTGLNIEQAQRCMRAAREIKEGSALARLEMSKALALLGSGLDKSTQETMAQHAADEGTTVRELREQIEKYRRDLDNAGQAAIEAGARAAAAEQKAFEKTQDAARSEAMFRQACDRLQHLEKVAAQTVPQGISAEAQAIIDGLREDLEAAERREEKKAEQLQALRDQQHRQAMDDARGLTTSTLSGFDLATAVRSFIGSAGVLPQMSDSLRQASASERRILLENIETVAKWVDGARAALGVVVIDEDTAVVE